MAEACRDILADDVEACVRLDGNFIRIRADIEDLLKRLNAELAATVPA